MLVASQLLPYETNSLDQGSISWWESFTPQDVSQTEVEEIAGVMVAAYEEAARSALDARDSMLSDPSRPKMVFSIGAESKS